MPLIAQKARRKLQQHWQRLRPDPLLESARRVYRGIAPSKSEVLGQYTFAICFENMIINGWVTEKIFDCFYAGTVPIYLGAPDIDKYVRKDCFIDMRDFSDYAELGKFLRSLGRSKIQEYKENAREYLRSPMYRPFTKEAFADLFCTFLQEDLGVTVKS